MSLIENPLLPEAGMPCWNTHTFNMIYHLTSVSRFRANCPLTVQCKWWIENTNNRTLSLSPTQSLSLSLSLSSAANKQNVLAANQLSIPTARTEPCSGTAHGGTESVHRSMAKDRNRCPENMAGSLQNHWTWGSVPFLTSETTGCFSAPRTFHMSNVLLHFHAAQHCGSARACEWARLAFLSGPSGFATPLCS